jgi:hypothetical protein
MDHQLKALSTAMDTMRAPNDMRRSRELAVSLRGTLAFNFMHTYRQAGVHAAHAFVCQLLDSENPDIVQVVDGALLVIGLASERGQFSPDW